MIENRLKSENGEPYPDEMDVVVLESWGVIDLWWTDTPLEAEFVSVWFMGRRFVFKRISGDSVWRVVGRE